MAIEVAGLTKVYRSQTKQPGFVAALRALFVPEPSFCLALDQVSFSVAEGELLGVLGPNGAGKTTLLKLLSGLLYPTDGQATVSGQVPWRREAGFKRKIAMVMGQKNQLWWDLPATDTFLWLKEVYEIPRAAFESTVQELAQLLEVQNELNVQVRRLSLGQRMKLELIAALLHKPGVLFLDEPTLGLDIVAQRRIRTFIKDYNRHAGTTVLVTSHQMADIEDLCRRVIILSAGRLTYDGGLEELVRRHCDYKFIAVTLAEGQLDAGSLGPGVELVEAAGQRYLLRVPRQKAQALASRLWADYAVADLDLREPAASDVIERLFLDAGRGESAG